MRKTDSAQRTNEVRELTDAELDAVTGGTTGKVTHSDLQIMKYVDRASPILF